MNVERLLDLAEKLKTVKPSTFNLVSYFHKYDYMNKAPIDIQLHNDCGTTACAVGYLPVFYPDIFEYSCTGIKFKADFDNLSDKNDSAECSEQYFDINEDQWEYLFEYASYRVHNDPLLVVEHIHKLVEDWRD